MLQKIVYLTLLCMCNTPSFLICQSFRANFNVMEIKNILAGAVHKRSLWAMIRASGSQNVWFQESVNLYHFINLRRQLT